MKTKFLIILILLSTPVLGCTSPPKSALYENISVAEAKALIDTGGYFILDVRTQEEYDAGHIADSVLIPHDQLSGRLNEVPKGVPILVYCRTARRSSIASGILTDNGYKEVYNMEGGIVGWEKAGYPVEKQATNV